MRLIQKQCLTNTAGQFLKESKSVFFIPTNPEMMDALPQSQNMVSSLGWWSGTVRS